MKSRCILVLFVVFGSLTVSSQIYSGLVIDNETGEPLPYANIFIEGTLKGTISNVEGQFELNIDKNISSPVVISFVGYVTKVLSLKELEAEPVVRLEQKIQSIHEVDIKSGASGWPREKMMKIFKEEFLGTSFNAKSCKIENEDDIYLFYNEETEVLHASSQKPVIIENKKLGYNIYYLLEYFRKSENGIQFAGYSRFEEHLIKSNQRQNKVDIQRREAYLGSIMHFIRNLYSYDLNGIDTIYDMKYITEVYKYHNSGKVPNLEISKKDMKSTALVSKKKVNNIYLREYENKFQLHTKESEFIAPNGLLIETKGKKEIFGGGSVNIVYLGNLENSRMLLKTGLVEIFEDGYYNPEQISWGGAMSQRRVGDLLPLDFKYESTTSND